MLYAVCVFSRPQTYFMNRNLIMVRNINHLTDARYFAAMGVDWMSIPLTADPKSFSIWHMLKEWIEGVKLAAEINGNDEMLFAKTIIDAAPDGIILSDLITPDIPSSIQIFHESDLLDTVVLAAGNTLILEYEPGESMVDRILQFPTDKIFLQTTWTTEQLEELLSSGYRGGICFSGGQEDITGVKDYGMMDEMLGLLQD